MKINFKIMWIDDKPKQMETILSEIEDVLKENYYIPKIEEAFQSYEDFMAIFDVQNDDDINIFNDCDLLLIDFHLSQKIEDDEKTGEILIEQLRNKGIFTEVVFYSDAMAEYRQNNNRHELDNVTYADKNEVVRKVEYLVKKTVRQGLNISTLRGYLMDSTSEFDFICKEVAIHHFKFLDNLQKKTIIEKIEKYIQEQFESEADKFKKNNAKYHNILAQVKEQKVVKTFSENTDTDQMLNILINAFNSKEAVMPTDKKYRILANILSSVNIVESKKIYSHNPDTRQSNELYKEALITPRNKLAHSKLIYGKHCGGQRIKIVEKLTELTCKHNELCSSNTPTCADKSYSYEDCKKLRKNIYEFYLIFNDLFEYITRI
jgi:hypothetical protein